MQYLNEEHQHIAENWQERIRARILAPLQRKAFQLLELCPETDCNDEDDT